MSRKLSYPHWENLLLIGISGWWRIFYFSSDMFIIVLCRQVGNHNNYSQEMVEVLTYDSQKAMRALCKKDRTLAELIQRAGPINIEFPKRLKPFDALLRSIIYQQLSGRAAATIHKRVRALFSGRDINPHEVVVMDDQMLRNAGMSRAKVASVNDLAQKTMDGLIPSGSRLREMSDADIVENLTQVRGIGEWTVQMLLMFHLGRPDVLPTKDLGVRKGFMLTYGLDELPAEKEMMVYCERWRPYRSVGSWYMWRALEL